LLVILAVFCYNIISLAMLFCCDGNCASVFRPMPNLLTTVSAEWNDDAYYKV